MHLMADYLEKYSPGERCEEKSESKNLDCCDSNEVKNNEVEDEKRTAKGIKQSQVSHDDDNKPFDCMTHLESQNTVQKALNLNVSVLDVTFDENNNVINCSKNEESSSCCWVQFLSCLCFCRMSSDSLEKVQTARVQDSETWDIEKGSKYTVYKVVVHSGTSSWFVFRRYTEFHKLFESLKKQVPNLQLKLPGKKIFGNNLDPGFIATRRGGLDNFVQKIISQPSLLEMTDVREFFKLDNLNSNNAKGSVPNEGDVNLLNLGPSERCHAKPTDFEFLRVIGQGSFGKVLLARHKTENKYYAVKVLNKGQVIRKNEARHIMTERNVLLKTLNHPFLVGLHYSFQTPEKLYFVLDYVNGGELFFHLQNERVFSESRSRFYAAEMACALGYLHSKGIIYRDLKPENILLDAQGHVVLTDFGLSKEGLIGTDTTKTFCGTPEYLAPEIILKEEYDRSVDWWCLGIVLYEMLFGWPPFYCRDTSKMYERIVNKPLALKGTTITENARDILCKLLEKDKSKRLGSGYGDFEDVKNHSFFKHINWDDLINKRIKPPFNPHVEGVLDLKHIDPDFTKERIPESIEQISERILSASVREADEIFAGFSYAPQTAELSA